ncbi:MAG TPA: hypothetical protein VEG34_18770 [Thermoanaerobaculia bacterium]|nr:hypothetical protein [Thermoanaerobaculia bacterium]
MRRWLRPSLLLTALLVLPLAACSGGYDRDDHDTPTDPGSQFLILTAEGGASLPADGTSRLRLTAQITPDATQRVIDFTTSAGVLVGGTGTDGTLRSVTVDSSGRAQVELRSALTPGTALVTARVKDAPQVAQSLSVAFVDPGPDALLRVVAAPTAAPADGASASRITVQISPLIDAGARNVRFQTNLGSFAPGGGVTDITVPAAADLTASVLLYSPGTIGEALVRVTAGGVTQEVRIRFDRALPDRLLLGLDKLTVTDSAADQIVVTATLLRDLGTVTPGTEVTFEATRDDTGGRFGLFNPASAVTAADGTATVRFSPAGSGYTGRATITARAPNGRTASVSFQVTAP